MHSSLPPASPAPPSAVPRHRGLQLIAVFKFVKATVLIAGGLGALGLWAPGRSAWVHHWLEGLSLNPGRHLVARLAERALALLGSVGPHGLRLLAVGAFLYAAVFLVEGIGLARARRWAEYLTVAVTTSFLPIEVVALWHRWTLPRLGTILLNIVVIVYLLLQLRTDRGPRPGTERGVAPEEPSARPA